MLLHSVLSINLQSTISVTWRHIGPSRDQSLGEPGTVLTTGRLPPRVIEIIKTKVSEKSRVVLSMSITSQR